VGRSASSPNIVGRAEASGIGFLSNSSTLPNLLISAPADFAFTAAYQLELQESSKADAARDNLREV
jgi:hypothetical protein